MSMTNGVISLTDVTTDDVKRAISHASTNVGVLCSSPNINKWAQYKPVRYGVEGWGKTGFYTSKTVAGIAVVDYSGVAGGESEPYCLGHFRGYNHNTKSPALSSSEDEVYIDPNGRRAIMLKYVASGLDFTKEGYNAIVVTQSAPAGGGSFIIGAKRLDEVTLNEENTIEASLRSDGMALGGTYHSTVRVGFGSSSASSSTDASSDNTNIYATVGDTANMFSVSIKILCTEGGVTPPTPPTIGKYVVRLVDAPASIMSANPACDFHWETTNQGYRYMKFVSSGWGEEASIPSSDYDAFKFGRCSLWCDRGDGSGMKSILTGLRRNEQYSPAFGVYWMASSGASVEIPVPPTDATWNYELRWSRY